MLTTILTVLASQAVLYGLAKSIELWAKPGSKIQREAQIILTCIDIATGNRDHREHVQQAVSQVESDQAMIPEVKP